MKRFTALRVLVGALNSSDVAVFVGDSLIKEAHPYDREGNLYLPSEDYIISLVAGMAMNTKRRVYLFCEEEYFIRNIGELMQAAVSRCKNLYLFLILNGRYTAIDDAPTVFDSVSSKHGILYDMGFLVHNYTKYFEFKNVGREIKSILERTRGPLSVLLNVEKGDKKLPDVVINHRENMERVINFMSKEEEIGEFIPPVSLIEVLPEGKLNGI